MNRKLYYLLGSALLLLFAGFSFSAFRESLTPYVSFDEARGHDHVVQVAGGLEKGSSNYDAESESLHFTLVELEDEAPTGKTLQVRYEGLKPANFEDAISIVAIGRYDAAKGELAADKLLVKCPSKYQGLESAETKSYS